MQCLLPGMKREGQISISEESMLSSLDIQGWNLKSFAEELYENTGQLISLAKVQLATIDPEKKEETKNIIENSDRILNQVIKNLRSLARQLTPTDIIRKGFLSSLEYELERMNQLDLWKIHFTISGSPFRTDTRRELILFSVIQHYILEALYVEKAKKLSVIAGFSADMMKIRLSYPANPELLAVKKREKGMGMLQRAEHIGAVIISKRKSNSREISICLKK